MAKVRISTTVDGDLLDQARQRNGPGTDASLLDAALRSFLREHRAAAIDRAYAEAFRETPADTTDDWGSLSDFLDAAARR